MKDFTTPWFYTHPKGALPWTLGQVGDWITPLNPRLYLCGYKLAQWFHIPQTGPRRPERIRFVLTDTPSEYTYPIEVCRKPCHFGNMIGSDIEVYLVTSEGTPTRVTPLPQERQWLYSRIWNRREAFIYAEVEG